MLVKPLKIGQLTLANNLIQGPLAGYSCAPFRLLTHQFGQPAYCTTEMISAKDLIKQSKPQKRYIWKAPKEGFVSYQLSGSEPKELAQATKIVTDAGADLIDLNCGCPVNKIRTKGCGSKLLGQPDRIALLVEAVKANTAVPVTVKIRIDAQSGDNNNATVVKAIESAGADALVVHGRHWTEGYDVPCNLEQIAQIAALVTIPVIANGDVIDTASFKRALTMTQAAGVMIARAGVGQPWIFRQITAELNNQAFTKPSMQQIGAIFIEHVEGLAQLESEFLAVIQSRKLAKYYIRQQFEFSEFQERLNKTNRLSQLKQLVISYFI